ncbi:hypothetical protein LJC46_09210 [Desulfovibrio sp. OttesenSCG-928-G15]|nr:hypothetical protein [Desulfovibrio sp. OttesenSCG-928-G15]
MRTKLGIAATLLLLVLPFSASALSDAEYKRFVAESPAFATADKRLVHIWEKLRKALPKKDYETLLIEQRDWLQRARDIEAKAEKDAPTLAAAYAAVTERRAAILEGFLPTAADQQAGKASLAPVAGQIPPEGSKAQQQNAPAPVSRRPPATALPHDKDGTAAPLASGAVPQATGQQGTGSSQTGSSAPGVTDNTLPHPAPFEGAYAMDDGELDVRSVPGGFDVTIERRGPGKTWTCKASGRARLEENTLILLDKDHPEAAPIAIQIESNKMLITRSFPAFCAPGGTLGGVYVKLVKPR